MGGGRGESGERSEVQARWTLKGRPEASSKTICENASCAPGPVIVAGEPDSMPAAAYSASCLQLPSLAVCKTLGAHLCIQAFRRRFARFLNKRAGWAAGLLT